MLTFWQAVLMIFITFLCVYTILDRLCKCIEICSTNRSYKKFLESMNKGCNDGKSGNAQSCESRQESENSNI